jgi:hypothetical protein
LSSPKPTADLGHLLTKLPVLHGGVACQHPENSVKHNCKAALIDKDRQQ